jgi:hypothetical protein
LLIWATWSWILEYWNWNHHLTFLLGKLSIRREVTWAYRVTFSWAKRSWISLLPDTAGIAPVILQESGANCLRSGSQICNGRHWTQGLWLFDSEAGSLIYLCNSFYNFPNRCKF